MTLFILFSYVTSAEPRGQNQQLKLAVGDISSILDVTVKYKLAWQY